MEDNNNYTYTYRREKKKEIQRTRIILLAVCGVAAVFCIIFGVLFGNRAAVKAWEKEQASREAESESTSTVESTTQDPSPYKAGEYQVNTEGYSLKFRKDHSTDGDVYLEIPDGTKVTVDEIYHDENAAASGSTVEYWGKITYKGYTGWIAMNYLKKAYSDSIVTPEDLPSSEESTTAAPESTTLPPETTTEAPADTTAAPEDTSSAETPTQESTTASAKYTAGDYVVSTGGYTLTFRKSASKSGETILSIDDGTRLTVTKIVEVTDSEEKYRYWGEVTYKGHTGYVSMAYLEKVS